MQREDRDTVQENLMQENLIELRIGAFKTIIFLTVIIGWVWFTWAAWPQDGYTLFRSNTWMVSGALVALAIFSHVCANWSLSSASKTTNRAWLS